MSGKKPLSEVERVLDEHVAGSQLESLVSAGCDRTRLLDVLDLGFLTDASWMKLVEMNRRAFKAEIAQIQHCADVIDRLNRTELLFQGELHNPRFSVIHQTPTLSDRIRDYAKAVKSLPYVLGPKPSIMKHVWKAQIVAIVIEETGKPHDPEVSSLISAILSDPGYSPRAHKQWRLKHLKLVAQVRRRRQERRAQRMARTP